MKRTELSTANSRQKSKANCREDKSSANSRQGKPKDYDRDKAKHEDVQSKAAATHPASQSRSIQEQMQMSSRGRTK